MTTDDTSRSPSLGGEQREGPTGREPGLPRLHQLNLEEMHPHEVIDMLDTNQMRLLVCEFVRDAFTYRYNINTIDGEQVFEAFDVLQRYAENRANNYELRKAKDSIRFIPGQVACAVWSACGGDKDIRLSLQEALYDLALYKANTHVWRASVKEVRNQQKARAIEYLTGRAE